MSLLTELSALIRISDEDTVRIPCDLGSAICAELESLKHARAINTALTVADRAPTGDDYCLVIDASGKEPEREHVDFEHDVQRAVLKDRAENAEADAADDPTNATKQLNAAVRRTLLKDYDDEHGALTSHVDITPTISHTPDLRWASLNPTGQQRLVLNTLEIVSGFDRRPFRQEAGGPLMFYWDAILYEVKNDGSLI